MAELYKKVFGKYITENSQKIGNNIMINCLWHDDKSPSLGISTDDNNPTYHCFGCGKKGSLIGAYMELNNVDYKTALKELEMFDENYNKPVYVTPVETKHKEEKEIDYSEYCNSRWNATIMHDRLFEFYGKKLYEFRGITLDTAVACGIGFDVNKGWIFPFCRLSDNKCTGYEVRHKKFEKFEFSGSKCYKAKDSESCLSVVWQGWENKKAIVCEGFIDSYFMYQYLHEKAQMLGSQYVNETILTPTNGVKTVPELIKENKLWEKFEEVLFVLDNDNASNPITEELKQFTNEKGYNFKFFVGLKEGQDFEDWYKTYYLSVLRKEV